MPNKCFPKNKEKLWKKACERYQNLSEKKTTKNKTKTKSKKRLVKDVKILRKKKKHQHYCEFNKYLSEDQKRKDS